MTVAPPGTDEPGTSTGVPPRSKYEDRLTVAVLPDTEAVPVPMNFWTWPPPEGVAVTVKALPAGAEPVSRSSSKVTVSVAAFTDAPKGTGGGPLLRRGHGSE